MTDQSGSKSKSGGKLRHVRQVSHLRELAKASEEHMTKKEDRKHPGGG